MVDHATAKYLNDNVGGILAKALAEMSVSQPLDGVDFLAQWLKTYAEQEEAKAWRDREEKTLEEERAKAKAKLDAKEVKRQERQLEKQGVEDLHLKLVGKLDDEGTTFSDGLWTELVTVVGTVSSVKAVYVGLLDEDGLDGAEAGTSICYTAASQGSEWMAQKTLPKDVGVTWGALQENPDEEAMQKYRLWKPPSPEVAPPEPVEGEEPPADTPPPTFYLPVKVDFVTDVPEIHFFDMTRLGAFVAVPMVYTSFHTKESLDIVRDFGTEQATARAAAQEEADTALQAAGGEEAEGADAISQALAAKLEEIAARKPVLKGKDVKMVLCMDTLGANTVIDEAQVMKAIELCKSCGACKSRTEAVQITDQATMSMDAERRQKIDEQIAEAREEATRVVAEGSQEEEVEENMESVVEKRKAYLVARKTLLDLRNVILELKSWVWVPPEMLNLIAAIGFMFGFEKADIYPERKTVLRWDKLAAFLDGQFFSRIEQAEVAGERKNLMPEQKLLAVKQLGLPDTLDEEAAKGVWPAFQLLFVLLQSACSYRSADLEFRKERYNKQKEDGENPPTEKLEDLDDDFAEA